MKLAAFILAAATTAGAATITVTITGTTGEIRVGEGPIFEHRSYTLIPAGDPFALTYTFDEERGKQTIAEVSNGLISQSEIENSKLSSPGTSATLQIGRAVWEFGPSARSEVVMKTSATSKSEQFVYVAQAGGNRVLRPDCSGQRRLLAEEWRLAGELHFRSARRQHRFLCSGQRQSLRVRKPDALDDHGRRRRH